MIRYMGKCLLVEERGKRILVVGDLHLGYEESLNIKGVLIGRESFNEMLGYFEKIFEKTGKVDKVILLGDVKHVHGKILRQEWRDALGLFQYLKKKLNKDGKIIIVRGNHDKILGPILRKVGGIEIRDYFVFGKYCFMHGDRDFKGIWRGGIRNWIMGHGHPAVRLSSGAKTECYKCFLTGRFKGREIIIVPSFFEHSLGSDPRGNELGLAWDFNFGRFRVLIVGDGGDLEVRDFGLLGDLR